MSKSLSGGSGELAGLQREPPKLLAAGGATDRKASDWPLAPSQANRSLADSALLFLVEHPGIFRCDGLGEPGAQLDAVAGLAVLHLPILPTHVGGASPYDSGDARHALFPAQDGRTGLTVDRDMLQAQVGGFRQTMLLFCPQTLPPPR